MEGLLTFILVVGVLAVLAIFLRDSLRGYGLIPAKAGGVVAVVVFLVLLLAYARG